MSFCFDEASKERQTNFTLQNFPRKLFKKNSFWLKGLILAFIIHASIIISFFLHRALQSPSSGTKNQIIQSYIWQGNSPSSSSQQQQHHKIPIKKEHLKSQRPILTHSISETSHYPLTTRGQIPAQKNLEKQISQSTQENSKTAGETQQTAASSRSEGALAHDTLAALLHQAIAEQISENGFEGAGHVEIAFHLLPDGEVMGAKIAASSGIFQLDQAALQAVRAISPFQPTLKYLKQPEDFTVKVYFDG